MSAVANNSNNAASSNNSNSAGLDKIMAEFRVGDKQSNIMQLNMYTYFPNDPKTKIASLLEQSNNLSNKVYRLNFDPVQEIILKKMVGVQTLDKRLIIEEHDFFKGIFLLNYYCTVIAKNYDVIDSLYAFALQIEKIDRHKDPVIKDVVEYILQDSFKKNIFVGNYFERGTRAAYDSLKQPIDLSGTQFIQVSPIYSTAAGIINDTLTNLPYNVLSIESRADLSALIFTDALYPYIRTDPSISSVNLMLEKKDFLNASISALKIASKNYYNENIDKKLKVNI